MLFGVSSCNFLLLLARRQQKEVLFHCLPLFLAYGNHNPQKAKSGSMKRPLSTVVATSASVAQEQDRGSGKREDDILRRITQELAPQLEESLKMSASILNDANTLFRNFLVSRQQDNEIGVEDQAPRHDDDNDDDLSLLISRRANIVANEFLNVATIQSNVGQARKTTRINLENAARQLTTTTTTSPSLSATNEKAVSLVSLSLVLVSLSIIPYQDPDEVRRRAAASAISAVAVNQEWNGESEHSAIAATVVHSLLQIMSEADGTSLGFDLYIIAMLARSFSVSAHKNESLSRTTGALITRLLSLENPDDDASLNSDTDKRVTEKAQLTGAMALATQIAPWNDLSVPELIQKAIHFDLWEGARRICESVVTWQQGQEDSATRERCLTTTRETVESLIDLAMESKQYRTADTIATNFFDFGGTSRYLDARFYHACDTIAKLVRKNAIPIIERQVERVDAAITKVNAADTSKSAEIRIFALTQLREVGEVEASRRLADLWNMDHSFDEEALATAVQARKEKYLQWEDVFPGIESPELISTADDLMHQFQLFVGSSEMTGVFGFDAEWGEDAKGVALLQLATTKNVILIDIPALSTRKEGADALKKTIGELFARRSAYVVGFACKQDMARLRATPCVSEEHWLGKTDSIVDVQSVVGERETSLRRLGLSRACEFFLGKPLDKAEQCSCWTARPLTHEQRVYAALDAWACAAIYAKVIPLQKRVHESNKPE